MCVYVFMREREREGWGWGVLFSRSVSRMWPVTLEQKHEKLL